MHRLCGAEPFAGERSVVLNTPRRFFVESFAENTPGAPDYLMKNRPKAARWRRDAA